MKSQNRKIHAMLRKIEDRADRHAMDGLAIVVASLCMALTAGNVNRLAEHCLTFQDGLPDGPFDLLASVKA